MEKGIILVALPAGRLSAETMEKIGAAGGGREVVLGSNKAETERWLDVTEIALGDISFSMIPRMPRLKWVQLWSAGADQLQRYGELKNHPFILTTTSGIHGPQIAEHFFGLLFAWNRRFQAAFEAKTRGEWQKMRNSELVSVQGKTLLIAGFGAIGEIIARCGRAFGMNVIGLRRRPGTNAGLTAEGVRVEDAGKLHSLLPLADVVVNILPFTQDTKHLFGKTEFSLMKNTALYANVGRGITTDEAALTAALREGSIAGALLDVFETEPLPPDSPLWTMDNVILTAHYAGLHPAYDDLALEIAFENLKRYVRGEPLVNVVDKAAGY